ncbi:hypothetical protein ETU10_08540 [Apibacter muscae]|uniref:hypothetical protein n=1 Tax=Apibacter muscae TaxID=2509004 RepID=UPI0011ACC7B6|nr:hypothetical protein [Apibacter muscae]TWP23134.1 hypothetical protein ETU10_08540 [Apibacter muscae]
MDASLLVLNIIFLIITIIIPGLILKRFYYLGEFSNQFNNTSTANNVISTIFLGSVVVIFNLLLTSLASSSTFTTDQTHINNIYENLSKNKIPPYDIEVIMLLIQYLFTSVILAILIGFTSHKIVRILKLDVKFPLFRFSNHWHYYFKGEISLTKPFKHINKKINQTFADILFRLNGEDTILYSGVISQFTTDKKTNDLKFIYLTNAKKRKDEKEEFKDIPGDCFVIPFDRVININIQYLGVNKEEHKSIVRNKIYLKLINFISIILFLSSFILIIFPWVYLNDISWYKKIFGIISSLLALFFLMGILLDFVESVNPKNNKKHYTKINNITAYIILFICFSLFTTISLYFYNLLHYLIFQLR